MVCTCKKIGIKEALFSANYTNTAVDEKQFIYQGDADAKDLMKKKENIAVIWSLHVLSLALWLIFLISMDPPIYWSFPLRHNKKNLERRLKCCETSDGCLQLFATITFSGCSTSPSGAFRCEHYGSRVWSWPAAASWPAAGCRCRFSPCTNWPPAIWRHLLSSASVLLLC